MLYIFGGPPATGKTTLARLLASEVRAAHVRIDTVEQRLCDVLGRTKIGPEGYAVAYGIAGDNLSAGLHVVADSVNPLTVTRHAWRQVARDAGTSFAEIEVVCSDPEEHRGRVQTRTSDVPGLRLPGWEAVTARVYEDWDEPRIVIDTARCTPEESYQELRRELLSSRQLQDDWAPNSSTHR